MHTVDGAVGRRRGEHGPGRGRGDAKPRFLALHVTARLPVGSRVDRAVLADLRGAALLGRSHDGKGYRQQDEHGQENGDPLPFIPHIPAKGEAQGRWDQQKGDHFKEIGQGRGVLKGMRGVVSEETAAIGSQLLDRNLAGRRPQGDHLLCNHCFRPVLMFHRNRL